MKETFSIFLSVLTASLALLTPTLSKYQLDDFVLVDYQNVSIPFSNFSYKGIVSSTNRTFTAFVAVLPSGVASDFSFQLPKEGKLNE